MRLIACMFASALLVITLTVPDTRARRLAPRVDEYLNAAVSQGKFSGSVRIARAGKVKALYAEKLLAKDSHAAMFQPYVTLDWGDGAAYGWFIGADKPGHRYIGFPGGINGFAALIMRYPDQGVLLVVHSNFSFAPVGDIGRELAAIVFNN